MKLWLSSLNLNMLLANNTFPNKFDDIFLCQTAIIEQMNGEASLPSVFNGAPRAASSM